MQVATSSGGGGGDLSVLATTVLKANPLLEVLPTWHRAIHLDHPARVIYTMHAMSSQLQNVVIVDCDTLFCCHLAVIGLWECQNTAQQ